MLHTKIDKILRNLRIAAEMQVDVRSQNVSMAIACAGNRFSITPPEPVTALDVRRHLDFGIVELVAAHQGSGRAERSSLAQLDLPIT